MRASSAKTVMHVLAIAALALPLRLAHADVYEDAKAVDAAATHELEHTLTKGSADQKAPMVPDADEPPPVPAAAPAPAPAPARKGRQGDGHLAQDSCRKAHRYWFGGRCHLCPVGKVRHGKACECPEGFLDNGPRLSCRCPEGFTVFYKRDGMHCRGSEKQISEARESRKQDQDLEENDDRPGGACTGSCVGAPVAPAK